LVDRAYSPPAVAGQSELQAISCPTVTACIATGVTYGAGPVQYAVAMSWDGTVWTSMALPNVPAAGRNHYDVRAVDCLSPTWCKAAADSFSADVPFFLTLNGATWTVDPAATFPANTQYAMFKKISCFSQSFCAAVGNYVPANHGSYSYSLAEEWNGKEWRSDTVPVNASELLSVSCPTAKNCTAAGTHNNVADHDFNAIIEHKNSTLWTSGGVPSAGGYSESGITDITCSSNTSCIGVGYRSNAKTYADYAATLTGSKWTFDVIPSGYDLGALSCPTTTFCMDIGTEAGNQIPVAASRG